MKISVVCNVYNILKNLKLLAWCLDRQTRPPDEVVIVDDGSDHPTPFWELCQEHGYRYLRLESGKAHTAHYARNVGIELAHYDWVLSLEGDAAFDKDFIACLEQVVSQVPEDYPVVFAFMHDIRTLYSLEEAQQIIQQNNFNFPRFLEDRGCPCTLKNLKPSQGPAWHARNAYLHHKRATPLPWDPALQFYGEYDLVLQSYLRHYPVYYVRDIVWWHIARDWENEDPGTYYFGSPDQAKEYLLNKYQSYPALVARIQELA